MLQAAAALIYPVAGAVVVLLLLAIWDDLRKLLTKAIDMIKSVQDFTSAMTSRLTSLENAEQSVLTLLSSQQAQLVALRAELANAGVTPEQLSSLDAFLTTLDGDTAKLTAAAVVQGTPAEGDPLPEPAPAPEAIEVHTTALADGTVGAAYTGALEITGGTGPYKVLSSPPSDNGVTIGEDGSASGTPEAEADSTFVLTVSDSADPVQTVNASVTLHVDAA